MGPEHQDLASFMGCFLKENNHPEPPGIKFYPMNMMTEREIRYYVDFYLKTHFELVVKLRQE